MRLSFLARHRRAFVALAIVVSLPILLAWLVLPLWLRGFAEAQASTHLGRQVTIQALRINPLRLSLTIEGVTIGGAQGNAAPAQLKLARAEVNADLRSLLRMAPVIESVDLKGLEVQLARLSDGRYDVDDVIARLRPAQPSVDPEPARFALYNLRLTDGSVRFDDRPKGRVHELKAIQLGVPFLSNLEDAVDVQVEPHLAFQLDGAALDTGAQATPFAQDRAGTLSLKTGDIDVTGWLPYLPADLPLRPVAGQLAVDLTVHFRMPPKASPQVGVKGQVRAKGVRVADAAGVALAEWKTLSVQLADAEPLQRRVALGEVAVDGLQVLARRDGAGRLNWLQALAPGQPGAAAAPAQAAPAWRFSLARLELRDSRLQWEDDAVQPASRIAMDGLQVDLEGLQWPSAERTPARLKAQARLSADDRVPGGAAAPAWQATGEWTAAGGRIQLQASEWALGWAAPYLGSRLKPRVDGRVGFDLTAMWTGAPGSRMPTLQLASLQVDDFQAIAPGDRKPAVGWKQLRLADVTLDSEQRGVSLGELDWQQPVLRARRDSGGQVDLLQWWQGTPGGETGPEARSAGEAEPSWHVQLKRAAVTGGRVAWQDDAAGEAGPAALELQALTVELRDMAWPAAVGRNARLQGSAQVTSGGPSSPGRLSWQGELGQSPWAWRGSTRIERFPVHSVVAYAGPLPVAVARAELGWVGQVTARAEPAGLRLSLQGDARVGDLSLYPRAGSPGPTAGDALLSWQALELPKLRVELVPGKPPKVEMGEARLTDFYARLLVDEAGHFNLADLNAAPPAANSSAAPAASAVAVSMPAEAASAPALDVSVGGLQLSNGRVDFSDHFIRPNYSAALSELSGRLGAFRSGTREMAPLELRGRVAGSAQLDIRGAVNPTAKPLALDVQARASDLDLAPLSPYAGKYAGYAIERGKLSMDVSYRIEGDGRLDAKNQIVLNQLTFGDRIESPDATKLPVLLAVALLKDRHGVIDLNLPVGGSLNDPEFSIGGVVLKLIGNLLAKAVTSPFALLAGGDAEDLSQVEFVPGTARLAPSASSVLDRVARSLADRPGLQMTVTGVADPRAEREAIQAAWLDERLAAEHRKGALSAGAAASAPASAPAAWPADVRARLVRRLYADAKLPNKPRNVLGLAKDIPPAEMEALLRASHPVDTDNARELALQRGLAVRDALMAKGLPSERLFLAAPALRAAGEDAAQWTPAVQLSLATP